MAVDIRKVRKLIELIEQTGVGEIEIKEGEESVRISKSSSLAPAQQFVHATPVTQDAQTTTTPCVQPKEEAPAPSGHEVTSPMVGTAYLASKPGDPPFVEIGQPVKAGEVLCLIEAMKMFNQIEADKAGILRARLIENGQPVEYGQTLFIVEEV